jgi:hypothetical protein
MADSGKYGQVSVNKIGADEPIFILRAQDKLAVPAMEMYQSLIRSHGSPLAEKIQTEIDKFKSWPGPRKIPD